MVEVPRWTLYWCLLGKFIPMQLPVSRRGQWTSAGWGACVVHAAGAVVAAGLRPETPVGNEKGNWLLLHSRRAVDESCWEAKWEISSKS